MTSRIARIPSTDWWAIFDMEGTPFWWAKFSSEDDARKAYNAWEMALRVASGRENVIDLASRRMKP